MNNLEKLTTIFERFPGVGARQAKRFAFHLLTAPEAETNELAHLVSNLKQTVHECHRCHRFFAGQSSTDTLCRICSDPNRNRSSLLVVAADSDIQPIERAGVYDGLYFVLGGTVPLLDKNESNNLRSGALKALVSESVATDELTEIILGFSVNPDGENTGRYVTTLLKELISEHNLSVTVLGRGLSTGSELEYADPDTIKNAFLGRG